MSIFKRNKKKSSRSRKDKEKDPGKRDNADASGNESSHSSVLKETSPQRVGIVSGVLTTSATSGGAFSGDLGADIVDRHFGPKGKHDESVNPEEGVKMKKVPSGRPPRHEHLRAVDDLESLKLEIDPMARIGHATTITGNIVADEDLEVQGTIDGAIRLANHQLTVGQDGHVKATVEAHTVLVTGRISGDVVASDLVEIKPGGIIGGDVKAPRVIMHDGGIVVGGLDMSASLPSSGESSNPELPMPERPKLKSVESPRSSTVDETGGGA